MKNVFAEAAEESVIDRNIIATLKRPEVKKTPGRWFTIDEQKLIQQHKIESGMPDEIDFYLMIGCRASEALTAKPDFERCTIYVKRTKANGTSGFVKISKTYCNILKEKWPTMFKHTAATYSNWFTIFLKKIGIKQDDTVLHSLRHTFCSNLLYLGVSNRARQYLRGHKSGRMTNDVYTSYDPNVKRQDIINIYGDLYPDFEDTSTLLAS